MLPSFVNLGRSFLLMSGVFFFFKPHFENLRPVSFGILNLQVVKMTKSNWLKQTGLKQRNLLALSIEKSTGRTSSNSSNHRKRTLFSSLSLIFMPLLHLHFGFFSANFCYLGPT